MKSYNPFCSCSSHNQIQSATGDLHHHEQYLTHNLADHNIRRCRVDGDGNCLFYALAKGLLREMEKDPAQFAVWLGTFGLSIDLTVVKFAKVLRQICVSQWKSNENYYSRFVDTDQTVFLKEVKKFSKSGVSESVLGDIVPLTICNAFNIQIVIFTSVADLSRVDVKSETGNHFPSFLQTTVYLAYNQYGSGHYDAAFPQK